MKTVPDVITAIYGSEDAARAAFKIGRSALCNYKAWGFFPDRLFRQITEDNDAKGRPIAVNDVPFRQQVAA
jgi:hypothetical protein